MMNRRVLSLLYRGATPALVGVTVVSLLIPFAPLAAALGVVGSQEAKLLAGDPGLGDDFGSSIAVSGNTLVVGSPHDDDAGNDSGSAYVFVRVGTVWVQQAKLVPGDASAEADFGVSVDIDGDLIVVGAHQESPFTGPGAAYVFERLGQTWNQTAKLTASDGQINDLFGESVALSGTSIVVGSRLHDVPGLPGIGHGAAYIFVRQGQVWGEQAKLVADDAFDLSFFGRSVSIDVDTVAIGADNAPGPGLARGAVYVFERQAGVWSQEARIADANSHFTDGFGRSVSIDDDTLAVGIPFTDVGFNQSGSVQVHTRSGSSWSLQAVLMADDPVLSAVLGNSVSVSGDILVAGAPGDDEAGDDSGSAYVFVRDGAAWNFADKLLADDGSAGDRLGFSVSADTTTVALGGPSPFYEPLLHPGKAYVFGLGETPWTDLRGGTPGIAGTPTLVGSGTLVGGSLASVVLTNAAPGALMLAWISFAPTPLPAVGGTVHALPFANQLLLFSDGTGTFGTATIWPLGVAPGTNVWFQFAVQDISSIHGIALSNGLLATAP